MSSSDKPILLLVDDQPSNLQVLVSALKSDYRLRTATRGQAALDMLESGELPAAVLLDVMMPDLGGHEVLRRIRSHPEWAALPVILVTADATDESQLAGLEEGADDFLSKPVALPMLRARLRNLLQRQALRHEVAALRLHNAERDLAAAREQLQQTRQQLDSASKLELLGRLVASFAHDIASPIGNSKVAASGAEEALSALQRAMATPPVSRSAVEQSISTALEGASLAVRNLQRAGDLLAAFKQLALDQATAQLREIDLGAWLRDFVYTLKPLYSKTPHRIDIAAPQGLRLLTQPGPLGQVVGNLASNALIHAFDGEAAGCFLLSAQRGEPGWIELHASDNGRGMSAEVLARAFEPFYTTRAHDGGTGLGLDIVKHLVENILGGRLSVRSAPGEGSEFVISLPA